MDRIAPILLRTLAAIDRLGTFQAAADRLGTTQPAISARMRELELHLGIALFQRDGRRMALTARARQLVADSQPLLAELDRVLGRAADRTLASGIIRIGSGEIASASCVPGFVHAMQGQFPGVSFEIEIDLTARMLEHLLAGRSDMVFLAGPVLHPAIRSHSLGALDLVWLATAEAAASVVHGEPQTIWSLPVHSPLHHLMREAIEQHGLAFLSLNSCNNVRTLVDIVARSGCIGLFPETMVRAEIASGALVECLPRPRQRIEFQAAIRRRESDPLILQLFQAAAGLEIDPDAGGRRSASNNAR